LKLSVGYFRTEGNAVIGSNLKNMLPESSRTFTEDRSSR